MKKKLKKKTVVMTIVSLIIVLGILFFAYKKGIIDFSSSDNPKDKNPNSVETKKVKIVDLKSDTRPYAIMINNHSTARAYHAGLQDAYMIYEIIVEGGLTRYLALFKDKTTEKIGSVRSARHYFLDYVLENDAIFIHWGYSPQAQADMKSLKINHIDGITYGGTYFYRDTNLRNSGIATEHTAFTTMEMLNKGISKLGFRNTTKESVLLDYSVDAIDLSKNSESKKADEVIITYSNSVTNKYVYDSEAGVYNRFVNDKVHKDDITGKQYTFKNIITYQVDNDKITGDDKGRQDLYNTGNGKGYYISNGYATPITWEKKTHASKTIYKNMDGTVLKVNDGNTFIQIQPKGENLNILNNEANN